MEEMKIKMKWYSQWIWLTILCVVMVGGLTACDDGKKPNVVVCVPVYGQSLAMGEEATGNRY